MGAAANQQTEFDHELLFLRSHQIAFLTALAYALAFYFLGAPQLSIFLIVSSVILSPSIYILNRLHQRESSKLLFIFMCCLQIFGCSLGLFHSVNAHIYTIPILALVSILDQKNNWRFTTAGASMAAASGLMMFSQSFVSWINPISLPENMIHWISLFNFVGASFVTFTFIYYFKRIGQQQNETITNLLRSTNASVNSMLQARRELAKQRQFLDELIDAAPSGIYVKDLDGRYLICNKAFCKIHGKTKDQILGKTVFDLLPQQEAEHITNRLQEILTSKRPSLHEYLASITTGQRWHMANVFPMLDETGQPFALGGIVSDIHESKILRNQYQSLFDAIDKSAVVAMTDHQGKISFANKKFEELSGYSQDELLGKDHRLLNSGHHPKQFFKGMWETLRSGSTWRGHIQNKRKNGTYYWVDSTIAPMKSLESGNDGFVSIRFDITEQKNTELKLINSSKMASLGEMAAGVAHEINNPLAIISGKSSQLRRRIASGTFETEKVLVDIAKIEETCLRVSKIISAMRDFSRDGVRDPMEMVRLEKVVGDTIALCEQKLINSGVEFSMEFNPEIEFECRQIQIAQVLMNLILNAHDAAEEQNEKWVKLAAQVQDNTLLISVTDSGHGIPPEVVEKMMQPFYTTKAIGKGTGLGLSVSNGIIEDHQGKFWYDSQSQNTRFVLELPIKRANR